MFKKCSALHRIPSPPLSSVQSIRHHHSEPQKLWDRTGVYGSTQLAHGHSTAPHSRSHASLCLRLH